MAFDSILLGMDARKVNEETLADCCKSEDCHSEGIRQGCPIKDSDPVGKRSACAERASVPSLTFFASDEISLGLERSDGL